MTQLPFSWPTASDIERRRVLAALRFCNGDENHAAKLLRVSFPWLRSKLGQFEREGFLVPKARESEPAAILALASRNG
jgi:hypothetical protein